MLTTSRWIRHFHGGIRVSLATIIQDERADDIQFTVLSLGETVAIPLYDPLPPSLEIDFDISCL